MKNFIYRNLLLFAFSTAVLSACSDDDEVKTKGEITFSDQKTKITSGVFAHDTSPAEDDNGNVYHRNQLILFGTGLRLVESGDDEYEISGTGHYLYLMLNGSDQELKTGTYTWQSEDNQQPFDLWAGEFIKNANTANEEEYDLRSGTVTVTKSGDTFKISFSGTAILEIDGEVPPNTEPITVTAQFEGKLTRVPFDF